MYLRKITKVKLRRIYVIFNLFLSLGLTSRNILKFKFYLRKKLTPSTGIDTNVVKKI